MVSRLLLSTFLCLHCGGSAGAPPSPHVDAAPPIAGDAASPTVDIAPMVAGVPDQGRDPSIVMLAYGTRTCSGVVIGSNVVLTSKGCVATVDSSFVCPATGVQVGSYPSASSIAVSAGEDVSSMTVLAHGLEIMTSDSGVLCDDDIAAVIADTDLGIAPIKRSTAQVMAEDVVRTVAFDMSGTKVLREYVRVLALSSAEMEVGEATCQGVVGGAALEEPTGTLLGIASRSGSVCTGEGVHNVYTRADSFAAFIEAAITEGRAQGGTSAKAAPRPETEVGSPCATAADCSTGVCVESATPYCSYACAARAKCLTGFKCTVAAGASYCFEK